MLINVDTIVRNNLMTKPGYSPYCGDINCSFGMPRTKFDSSQFYCKCGWRSVFPKEFIIEYKKHWAEAKNLSDTIDIQF